MENTHTYNDMSTPSTLNLKNPKCMILRKKRRRRRRRRREREVTHIQAQTSSAFIWPSIVSKGQAQTKLI